MASKKFALESIGDVTITKRRGNRHLRLSVAPSGQVRVSIPYWASYQAGIEFAASKSNWINTQLPKLTLLMPGQKIGRAHQLVFEADETLLKPKTKINESEILVQHPANLTLAAQIVQAAAKTAAIRALRSEAEKILSPRIEQLALRHGLSIDGLKIKRLSRRWGSCNQQRAIVLNLFLVQLPDELVDYVILHELAHTIHLNHGPDFWARLEEMAPNAKQLRRQLRAYHPGLLA